MTGPRSLDLRRHATTRTGRPAEEPGPAEAAPAVPGPRAARWLVRCADDPTGPAR